MFIKITDQKDTEYFPFEQGKSDNVNNLRFGINVSIIDKDHAADVFIPLKVILTLDTAAPK